MSNKLDFPKNVIDVLGINTNDVKELSKEESKLYKLIEQSGGDYGEIVDFTKKLTNHYKEIKEYLHNVDQNSEFIVSELNEHILPIIYSRLCIAHLDEQSNGYIENNEIHKQFNVIMEHLSIIEVLYLYVRAYELDNEKVLSTLERGDV